VVINTFKRSSHRKDIPAVLNNTGAYHTVIGTELHRIVTTTLLKHSVSSGEDQWREEPLSAARCVMNIVATWGSVL